VVWRKVAHGRAAIPLWISPSSPVAVLVRALLMDAALHTVRLRGVGEYAA